MEIIIRISRSIRYLTTIVMLPALLPGCAFTDVHLDMPISGLEHPILGGNGREVVVGIPFNDTRKVTEHCGVQKNGYQRVTADAICDTSPSLWISQLLTDELRASRFKVLTPNEAHNDAALRINGDIQKVFVEPVHGTWTMSLETDLQIKLIASTRDGLRAERVFFAKGIKKGAMASTRSQYQISLKRAADEILAEMVEAIFLLMNKYPTIGIPDQPTKKDDKDFSEHEL